MESINDPGGSEENLMEKKARMECKYKAIQEIVPGIFEDYEAQGMDLLDIKEKLMASQDKDERVAIRSGNEETQEDIDLMKRAIREYVGEILCGLYGDSES